MTQPFTIILALCLLLSLIIHLTLFIKRREKLIPRFSLLLSDEFIKLSDSKNLTATYQVYLDSSQQIFHYTSGFIYLFSPQKDFLFCKQNLYDKPLKLEHEKISIINEEHFLIRTVLDDKPYIVPEVQHDSRIESKYLISPMTNGLIAYPLKSYDETFGVLLMNFNESPTFTEEQFSHLKILTFIIFSIIYNCKQQEYHKKRYNDFQKAEDEYREKMRGMQEQLLLSGKLASLGTLASGIAHEIRNPLTTIKMLVDALSEELTGDQAEDINIIGTEILRIEELTTHFLDFARPKPLAKTPCNVNRLLRETLNFLHIELMSRNIHTRLKLYSTLPNILCDHNQLKQVFINILLNAIDSIQLTKIETGLIEIKTSIQLKGDNKNISISIEDNGLGIPNEVINTIFDPFVTNKEKGTGLGLSISYRIIENHNGLIEAKNRIKGGAKFIINLPVT